ncbi:hypothetical protein GCM10023107_65180 [Actinoplanes octamycinicus]|nr:hypothetical protein Aoc01nite_15710 [Actinoplanes octamycinicus]
MRSTYLVVTAAVLVLAGCSGPDAVPADPAASGSVAGGPQGSPSAGRHWKGLAAQCPELTGDAAKDLGVGGAGVPGDGYQTNQLFTRAACRWGGADGTGNAVEADVGIYPGKNGQVGADAAWQVLKGFSGTPVPVGDEALLNDELGAVVVRVRSGNVVATVRLIPPSRGTDPAPLRKSAVAVTGDVLDDLVEG